MDQPLGYYMEETKAGTEMLNKCRLFCSFIYSLIHYSLIHLLAHSFTPSFIIRSFIYLIIHLLILSKESGTLPQSRLWGESHVASPCSSKGLSPPVQHGFPPWGPQLPGQEPTFPSTLCRT